MIRYSRVLNKNPREILLLRSRPCKWGRCFFCDYIDDNSKNDKDIILFNKKIIEKVTGEFKKLEIVNSASVFEIPEQSLGDIKRVVKNKGIKTLYFESHYSYRNRLEEIRRYFSDVEIIFKCGIETFDNDFRNKILNKGAYFTDYKEVLKYFESICLLVGIKGQTKEMIDRDINILEKYFSHGCINIYIENSTPIERDDDIVKWFKEKYYYLDKNPNIEILWDNTDFGIGGEDNSGKEIG